MFEGKERERERKKMMRGIVVEENMSNLTTSVSGEASVSSTSRNEAAQLYPPPQQHQQYFSSPNPPPPPPPQKKKRNLPGNPDPGAEVIALSPKSLLATNRFVCEICNKGFQRDQNLQLHKRGHNLPWKLKLRASTEQVRKKVYVCPEPTCVHHDPSRALGDLTGIKKHFCRKHGEKKWKCDKCSKRYAVQSDWKAHSKICGTREYRCDCGTLFSRRDTFITHRAFCDALAEETARTTTISTNHHPLFLPSASAAAATPSLPSSLPPPPPPLHVNDLQSLPVKREQEPPPSQVESLQQQPLLSALPPQNFNLRSNLPPWLACPPTHLNEIQARPGHPSIINESAFRSQRLNPNPSHHMSATALLQKAAEMGVTMSSKPSSCASSCISQQTMLSGPHNQAHVTTETGLGSREIMGSNSGTTGFGTVNSGFMDQDGTTSAGLLLQMHDVMMSSLNSPSGFQGSSFEDAFGVLVNPNGVGGGGVNGGSNGGNDGGNNGFTRDFLGLRSFSQKDFISMVGFDHVTSSSNSSEQYNPR
ncbi:Protein indeterminate-domain 11 [Ancistrocladus abbreviatus]